jgi:hypothetical protein
MTKNPRNHCVWTNVEVQEDAAGYLLAQERYHADQQREQEERRYQDDVARFTEAFVDAGGHEADAKAAFKASRNERATVAAQQAEEAASIQTRRRISQAL